MKSIMHEIWRKLTEKTRTPARDDPALVDSVIDKAARDVEVQRRTMQIYQAQRIAEGIQSEPKRHG